MSLPQATRPTDGAPTRSTRQLLDELDALMDQMLALPVVEDPVPPPKPEPKPAPRPSVPALTATLTMIEDIAPEPVTISTPSPRTLDEIPIYRTGVSYAPTLVPTVDEDDDVIDVTPDALIPEESVPLSPSPASNPGGERRVEGGQFPSRNLKLSQGSALSPPAPVLRSTGGEGRLFRPLASSTASWWYRSAVVWDRQFRRLTRSFGILGVALRSWPGRMFVGFMGLGMLATALGWIAKDLIQWPR